MTPKASAPGDIATAELSPGDIATAEAADLSPSSSRDLARWYRPGAGARSATDAHLDRLADAIEGFRGEAARLARWGEHLAAVLAGGGRLLIAGNGGSAAEAQHLAAELVGRMRDDRPAYSAIALTAETSSLTAIGNDYGYDRIFARQVAAHGRAGDVLVLLSTSGRSGNLLAAADTARELGVISWALSGPLPNPLAAHCDDVVAVSADAQTVQELHLVAVHALCQQVEAFLSGAGQARPPAPARAPAQSRSPVPVRGAAR